MVLVLKKEVVKTHNKLNTEMKKLVAQVKKHGIVVSNFKKIKFVEFKGSDLDSLIKNIKICSNPMVRCRPYNVKTVKEIIDSEVSLILEYYNKRINFLTALIMVIETM